MYANVDDEDMQQKVAENTYLLALDGDVDFEPQSVLTLVHKMRIDPDTAAVCGRIHPKGFGKNYASLSFFEFWSRGSLIWHNLPPQTPIASVDYEKVTMVVNQKQNLVQTSLV